MASGLGIIAIRGRRDRHGGESARLHARRRELTAEAERLAAERTTMTAAELPRRRSRTTPPRPAGRGHGDARPSAEQALLAADRVADRPRSSRAPRHERSWRASPRSSRPSSGAGRGSRASAPTTRATSRVEALPIAAPEALRERDEAAAARDAARDAWQAARGAAEAAEARSVGRRSDRVAAEARIAQLEIALPDHERAIGEVQAIRDDIDGRGDGRVRRRCGRRGGAAHGRHGARTAPPTSSSSWNGRPAPAGASSASSSAPPNPRPSPPRGPRMG